MYPWGALEKIKSGKMASWPAEDHEALRVAASLDPMVLVSADAFDRFGSLLTVLRVPLWRVVGACPVVVLSELEEQVREWGIEDVLSELRARVAERAARDVVGRRVRTRVLEVERTRRVIDGDLSGLEPVEVGDEDELAAAVGDLMVGCVDELRVVAGSQEWTSRRARGRSVEPQLLAWAAVRLEAVRMSAA